MHELRDDAALLGELVKKEIRVRYKRSSLGYLWSILNPLVLAAVFFVAFRVIMRVKVENYALFLITGLFAWQWFANSLQASATVYIGNASLVKKVRFRRFLLPMALVLNDLIHYLAAVPILICVALAYQIYPTPQLLLGLPVILVCQLLVTTGLALLFGIVNPYFRDMERLVGIFVTIAFYATPIVYPYELIPERLAPWFFLNPMVPIIESYHQLFLHGQIAWSFIGIAFAWGVAIFAGGLWAHGRIEVRLAEVL